MQPVCRMEPHTLCRLEPHTLSSGATYGSLLIFSPLLGRGSATSASYGSVDGWISLVSVAQCDPNRALEAFRAGRCSALGFAAASRPGGPSNKLGTTPLDRRPRLLPARQYCASNRRFATLGPAVARPQDRAGSTIRRGGRLARATQQKNTLRPQHPPKTPQPAQYCSARLRAGRSLQRLLVRHRIGQCARRCQRCGVWIPFRFLGVIYFGAP
jgi:hypothetical protein